MQLNFKLKIGKNGEDINISEPFGFDSISFTKERNKEFYGQDLSYSGNNTSYNFTKLAHNNVFQKLLKEYTDLGFEGFIRIGVYNGSDLLFYGDADLTSAETDDFTYFNCQFVERNKLYTMEKRKAVKTDLLNEPSVPLYNYVLNGIEVRNKSLWVDESVKEHNFSSRYFEYIFNTIRLIKKSEIRDTLTTFDLGYDQIANHGKHNMRIINANSEMRDLEVKLDISGSRIVYGSGGGTLDVYVAYGDVELNGDYNYWFNNMITPIKLFSHVASMPFDNHTIGPEGVVTATIPYLRRGQAVWFWFEVKGHLNYINNQNSLEITAVTRDLISKLKSVRLNDLIRNIALKCGDIQNVEFPYGDYYFSENHLFNGNMLRGYTDKPLELDWDFCKNILKERNYGYTYDSVSDTLRIGRFESFYADEKITEFTNIANNYFAKTTDNDYVKNRLSYKFKSFQANKEIELEGNANGVHGDSEWFIQNANVEGSLDVDLKFSRDGYLIEQQRIKAFKISENTSTNEDSSLFMVESSRQRRTIPVTENVFLNVSYDSNSGLITVANTGDYSFLQIGVELNGWIRLDNGEYLIIGIGNTTMELAPVGGSPILTVNKFYRFSYAIRESFESIVRRGLLSTSYSIRENLISYHPLLSVLNTYTDKPIENTMYKGNAKMVIDGIEEGESFLPPKKPLFLPKTINIKLQGSLSQYNALMSNVDGYVRVLNHNGEYKDIYPNKVEAYFKNGCNNCTFEIEGNLKT